MCARQRALGSAVAATRTIPIVMVHGAPLQLGAIDSLARPGGKVRSIHDGRGDRRQAGTAAPRTHSAMPTLSAVCPLSATKRTNARAADWPVFTDGCMQRGIAPRYC